MPGLIGSGSGAWMGSLAVALVVAAVVVAVAVVSARRLVRMARDQARRVLAESRQEADRKANEIIVAAHEKAIAAQEEVDRRESDLEARETALESRARQIEGDLHEAEKEKRDVERRRAAAQLLHEEALRAEAEAGAKLQEVTATLERAAGMTAEQARAELLSGIEEDARREGARIARRIEDEARERAEREALNLAVQATQRLHLKEAVESTVSFIQLPSDEMKGRIIGREGRNIRALESATGIDVIVDDTPGAILISSFDPLRREVSRVAIERLIEDGRIHPGRIEEVVERVRSEIETLIEEAGVQAAFGLGISDLHPRLARLIGRLRYRSHHGHNLLQHATEVALIAGYMAAEVGARTEVARRAGLLHEIGRVDESSSGHTILASAELAGKYGETEEVVRLIQSLHPDAEAKTVEGLILSTANRLSDNRPGARKDNLEIFIERLRRLETIAGSFPGVTGTFAVKAGKEIRVLVDTAKTSDAEAYSLSKQIARAIERDLDYPGQIKVSVIRESRSVQFAV